MSLIEKLYYLFKLAAFLLFCFAGGGWLIYDGVVRERQGITFDAVFPGAAAITAGGLAVGLLYYLRRGSRADEGGTEPARSASDAQPGAAREPGASAATGKPWRTSGRSPRAGAGHSSAKWFELTPSRRQLLLPGALALVMVGSLALRVRTTTDDLRDLTDATGGAAPPQQAALNRPPVAQPPHVQELERIQRATEKSQEFTEAAESAYSNLLATDRAGRQRLDAATEKAITSLRELQAPLGALQGRELVGAERMRVLALRKRGLDLIERLSQMRDKSRETENKK